MAKNPRHRLAKRGIPLWWRGHPHVRDLVAEYRVRVRGFSRLRAKVLIFNNRAALRHFWTKGLGRADLGPDVCGAVSDLSSNVYDVDKDGKQTFKCIEVDPRFFCVVGLLRSKLNSKVLSHEAGHVAFAYARRIRKTAWDREIKRFDEEAICYPLGEIYQALERIREDVIQSK